MPNVSVDSQLSPLTASSQPHDPNYGDPQLAIPSPPYPVSPSRSRLCDYCDHVSHVFSDVVTTSDLDWSLKLFARRRLLLLQTYRPTDVSLTAHRHDVHPDERFELSLTHVYRIWCRANRAAFHRSVNGKTCK